MAEHLPYPHLIELDYTKRQLVVGVDASRARVHVEKCPCGADVVRPWEDSLIALMADEWGIECAVDADALAYILSLTYDPVAREDIASGEVWSDERALAS